MPKFSPKLNADTGSIQSGPLSFHQPGDMVMDDYLDQLPTVVDKIRLLKDTIIANILLIGQVPAPTFKERRRANVFMERLAEAGVDECTTDGYRNPIGIIKGTDGTKPPIFIVAHLDTYWHKNMSLNYTVGENTISGSAILDNSTGVGVLASLPEIFRALDLAFESDIVLAGVIQSIGKGNLRGIRHLLKTWSAPIRAAICIEGAELGRLNYFSNGMIRGEIDCNVSVEDKRPFQLMPNAIITLNEIINGILNLRLPQRPASKVIIGKISGGYNHGEIAYDANMGFEIRSDSYKMVKNIYNNIKDIVQEIAKKHEVELNIKTISNLRAARLRYNHPLIKSAVRVMDSLNIKPVSESSESELSIFLSRNIPAITLGITQGDQHHLENSIMEIEPMFKGIAQIIGVIKAIENGACDEQNMA